VSSPISIGLDYNTDDMRIILTHEQADFDALASLLGAHLLDESTLAVLPRRMNRNLKAFLTLYGAELPFVDPRDLPNEAVEAVTLVDTQSMVSIRGMSEGTQVHLIDHHPLRDDLPTNWAITVSGTGANTTLFVDTIRDRELPLTTVQATLLLLGIYEDTGSLTYDCTTPRDLRAAGFLLEQGASLQIAINFLNHPLSKAQQELYDRLRQSIETRQVHGHTIVVACGEAETMEEELSSIAHKLRDLLDPDALFLLVSTRGGVQFIARSTSNHIDVSDIAAHFGGGGHERAAACLIKDRSVQDVNDELLRVLPGFILPAITVAQIMSPNPHLLAADTPVAEAAQSMQRYGYEGYPVVRDGKLVGLLTRRSVDRAIAHKLDKVVTSLMEAGEHIVHPQDSIEKLQRLMTETGWGQIPVVSPESGQIIGIVTRTDVLKTLSSRPRVPGRHNLAARLEKTLPEDRLSLLKSVAQVAFEQKVALYIVGGFARDLMLDRPSLDFDLVVEGDAIRLARALARKYGGRVTTHTRFGTAKWFIAQNSGLSSLDFISARTEFYTFPSALPTVERSSIKLDLHRRDFTINTLALRLDGRHYGELYDFWGGLADLRQGVVRVLHSLSFVDDPTRMLRAVRFEQRFNFQIESRTRELLSEAISLLERVSGDRIRHEIDHIIGEERAVPMLARLDKLALLKAIHVDLIWDDWFQDQLVAAYSSRPEPAWGLDTVIHGSPEAGDLVYALWLIRLPEERIRSVSNRLKFPSNLARTILAAHSVWIGLPELAEATPSRIVGFLDQHPLPSAYAAYLATDDQRLRDLLWKYAAEWRKITPTITGHDLRKRGVAPGPIYKDILQRLRAAWLDGHIATAEEETRLFDRWIAGSKETRGEWLKEDDPA